MQTVEGLKKEFAALRDKKQEDNARTIVLYMVDGELSVTDKEYMEKHPDYHYLIMQESDKALL